LNGSAILKIHVHRDCGKEFTDNRRFTLATNIAVFFCDPQSAWQRGSKFEEGPVLADCVEEVGGPTVRDGARR
jgi:hypothetical protein